MDTNTNNTPLFRDVKNYIIAALLLLTVGLILFQPSNEQPDTTAWQNEIERSNERIKILQSTNARLNQKIAEDSIRQETERTAFKDAIKKIDFTITKLKASPNVITVLQNNPEIAALVSEQDELIGETKAYVQKIETDLKELRIDLNKVTDNFSEQMKIQNEKFAALEAVNAANEKELKKQKRAVKWLKVVAIVGTVGGLFVGSR